MSDSQPTPAKAPEAILRLVARFEEHLDEYRSGQYNETQLRRDFLDPFWEALGWDIHNTRDYAEAYRDVIHEDEVKVGEATKAPDYGFRIGGARKFFLEAKKPSVVVKDDVPAAYQLRRYAWSAKLALSVLSDFEEFAVYDARVKPAPTDAASTARLFYCTFRDYAANWDFIAGTFSRDAVLRGSFDRYADSKTKKRGTATVDDAFLDEIEGWRKELAQNLALRNEKLTQRELNFAVQRIIDRVIFLRICEDRGIEKYGRLRALAEGDGAYSKLTKLFREADDRYNSGLFHFSVEKERGEEPDLLTPKLKVDDKVLRDIFKGLYYPQSPYEFSVISADMLGQVYERFLGNTIELSEGHRAKVVEKPEVRKAGGVYYTPTYIVDYIVKNTVGALLGSGSISAQSAEIVPDPLSLAEPKSAESKGSGTAKARSQTPLTPRQAAKLKVLDPACGSGSFLIGAYQYLLDWHLAWYVKDGAAKHATGKKPVLYQTQGGGYALTLAERKRILLDNIHGVDIDSQAVEVTKLSLVLKVLEGETGQSVDSQLKLFHERALPDLGSNIKCGNSLIGPDFYAQKELGDFSEEERYRINVFDWKTEFPEIMKSGGFDAVIGNPPYVRMELFKNLKAYLAARYKSHDERTDLYVYFVERSIALLRKDGIYGVIVSNKWIKSNYGKNLRSVVVENAALLELIDFGELPVFANAATFPAILIASRVAKSGKYSFRYSRSFSRDEFRAVVAGTLTLAELVAKTHLAVSSEAILEAEWKLGSNNVERILEKMRTVGKPLGEYCNGKIRYGIKTGLLEAFAIDVEKRRALLRESAEAKRLIKPYVVGDDVRKYHIRDQKRFLIYIPHGADIVGCDSVLKHLQSFKSQLKNRATKQEWYELQQPQQAYVPDYESPKIIYPDIAKESRFAFDDTGMYPADTTFVIPLDDLFLLATLNSKVVFFYLAQVCPVLGDARQGGRLRLKLNYVKNLPVPVIDPGDKSAKAAHDRMVSLVEQMLELHKQLPRARTPQEKTGLERQIAATDAQIDRLVYDLYGLTEDEIKIVESA